MTILALGYYFISSILGNGKAPVLDRLMISYSDSSTVVLEQPTFSTPGSPAPTVHAYLGRSNSIWVFGPYVNNALQGPIDVSSSGCEFSSLETGETYTIYVVASNTAGYSVQQIIQSTTGISPVLNSLSISGYDENSITLAKPTLSTAGNPAPVIMAYIGPSESISVSGATLSGYTQGPVDVSNGGYQFDGLTSGAAYTIIVVAANYNGYSIQQITQSTGGASVAPVLNSLSISSYDESSITISKPSFSTAGNPTPAVAAYIGLSNSISVSGSSVSGSLQGPIDVSSGGYQFSGLSGAMSYKIIVVAANSAGYSVEQITQSTSGGASIAPVLNNLSISGYDGTSITIAKPTFSTAGNPAPAVQAYIGVSGIISVSGSSVSSSYQGPIDVSSGGYQFRNLSGMTTYTIYVIAQNSAGYSVQQINQSTAAIAPVLNSLSISAVDGSSITIAKPTFSTAGNPTPTVRAYIGISGVISVSGSTVLNSYLGPIDVSSGGYQFSGLSGLTTYTIFVIALNSAGYSVQQINQSTAAIAPVLNSLTISAFDATSITIAKPTFSTAGNPTPTVRAYIGLSGTISVTGPSVSGALQGPIDVSTGGYQFSGLSVGTSYKIIVVAANSAGYSEKDKTQSTVSITIPAVPTGVTATDKEDAGLEGTPPYCNKCNPSNGIDGVTITWNASSYATSYNVYRSDPAYDGSGAYGSYTKINTSPVTGTSFLDDYGTWDRNPTTFRRLINVYRYKVTAVNAAGESAQSTYDEGSAQITTAEFFNFIYGMPLRYSTEKLIYEFGGGIVLPTQHKNLTGESGSGTMVWDLTLRSIIPTQVNNDVVFTNYNDKTFSAADYTSLEIYTDSIHNFPITFNGRIRAILDYTGSGWTNSVNSSHATYCSGICTEPPAPYWPNPAYLQYLHVVTVDADCYGWAMLHAYTPNAGNNESEAYTWVSYRGQRPVRMDRASLTALYKENGCP